MDNFDSQFSVQHFRSLYYQYKDTSLFSLGVSCLILVTNIFLYLWVVQPQYTTWQENKQKIADTNQKIDTLKKNIQTLSSQDPAQLTQNFQTAVAALPSEQDFAGVMLAISSAGSNAGIQIDTYKFQPGNLKSKQTLLPVSVTINVLGNGESLKKFLQEIHQKLPLANIKTIDGSAGETTVIVSFFSKSLSDVHFTEAMATSPLPLPTSKQLNTLSTLTAWQQTLLQTEDDSVVASSSSDVSPF